MSAEPTEPNQTDSGQREDAGLFRAIFSQAAVGMAQTSLTGDWLLVNDRLCEILGYTQAELRSRTFLDLTHPEDRDASLRAIRQLLSGEISSWMTEKRYIRKYGTIVWGRLFVSLVRDRSNQPQYFIAVVEEVTDKILAERALQESQQQLRLALSAGLGVWECDLRRGAVALSPQYQRVFGQAPLSYDEWMKLIHPDDLERVVAVAREGIERTYRWEAEFRVLWPDGSIRWMLSKATVILDEDRRPARMVGVSLDVTERKRSEEHRSQLAAIVESSDAAIVSETIDGIILSWNYGAEKLFGYKAEEIVGQHISRLIPAERQDRIAPVLEKLRRGERIEPVEVTRVRKDGNVVPVSLAASPVKDSTGAVIGISAIARDITKQKQAEANLRESEERFRNMADSAPVALWVTGPDGLATFWNKSALNFTGLTLAQLGGSSWTELVHPDDRSDCESTYSLALAERSSFRIECRILRVDGEYRWVLCRGVPRYSPDGRFVGYLGTSVDITHIKQAHEAATARQALESLGVLASGIAHDFNNLLSGILGQAELMEADLPVGSALSEEIQRIKTAAVRGSEIVRELMIYSGHETTNFEPVDVSWLVREMLELLKVSISKSALLKMDLGKNLPKVWGPAPQIRQVVMNLVINASEAIGADEGVIVVRTSLVARGKDLALGSAAELSEGDHVLLEVSDTGCGLTEEQKTRIFDPFFTTKFAGRGLGLAIVQGIVRSHRGTVCVESIPGQGTTLQVYLPCFHQSSDSEDRNQTTLPLASNSLAGRTVLVVEDEEDLRHSLVRMLRMKGLSVHEACDGSAALDLLRKRKYSFNVVLLDLTIPGASSRKVIDQAQRVLPDMKLIVMSAQSRESAQHSLKVPISAFLRKPFQFGDLLQVLRETLSF